MDTAEQIQRCQAGDESAIQALVHTHQLRVFLLALSLLDAPGLTQSALAADAEEATQDVFIAALRGLDSFRGGAAFSTWLYAITLNVCRNRRRKSQALRRMTGVLQNLFLAGQGDAPTDGPAPGTLLGPEEAILCREAGSALWQQVAALGDKHRTVVILRYYHDFPITEIAHMLGVSEGTIHSRLFTARERLRKLLKEPGVRPTRETGAPGACRGEKAP